MTTETLTEEISFSSRFYKHLKSYYMMFGIGGLIIAATVIFLSVIAYVALNIAIPIARAIPPMGYAIIGIISLPAILALIHTFIEGDSQSVPKNKNCPTFTVEIEKTAHDYSWVFLRAYVGWGSPQTIATKTPKNYEAQSVANHLLKHANEIYENYKNKPTGTFTEPISVDDEPLLKEINNLKQKIDELSKKKEPLSPITELEKKNRENNS